MNDLQVFNNIEFGGIRTLKISGEPWFVGKDVASALGYVDTDQALRKHVTDDDKLTRQIDGSGQNREMVIINESGLYSLILSSKLESAKRFKHWVTSEVLPSIRKTGTYSTPSAAKKSVEELAAADKRATAMLLNAKNRVANALRTLYDRAGIKPEYQAQALSAFYAVDGVDLPRIALQGTKQTYDKTTIAKMVGIYSKASGGKVPHAQAVGAIISQLNISEDEREALPYCRNGHDGVDYQYTDSVVEKVRSWTQEHGYPVPLSLNGKNYNVVYGEVAV